MHYVLRGRPTDFLLARRNGQGWWHEFGSQWAFLRVNLGNGKELSLLLNRILNRIPRPQPWGFCVVRESDCGDGKHRSQSKPSHQLRDLDQLWGSLSHLQEKGWWYHKGLSGRSNDSVYVTSHFNLAKAVKHGGSKNERKIMRYHFKWNWEKGSPIVGPCQPIFMALPRSIHFPLIRDMFWTLEKGNGVEELTCIISSAFLLLIP